MQVDWTHTTELLQPEHERRLSPCAALLVIAGTSLALWSAIVGIAVRVF
jgi:hypothetical protein